MLCCGKYMHLKLGNATGLQTRTGCGYGCGLGNLNPRKTRTLGTGHGFEPKKGKTGHFDVLA
jgi:hypothetical protein